MRKLYVSKIWFIVLFCSICNITCAQIAAWDFTGQNNVATSAATTFDLNLVSGGYENITRGPNASASIGNNSFRTTGFKNDGIAVTNTDYFQITLSAKSGYEISLNTIDAVFYGTGTFCASPGVTSQFAYSLDGTTFNLIGSPVTSMSLTMPQINVSGIADLQAVPSGTTITIRYYASGQTLTGGWGFSSSASGVNGLAVGGSVSAVITSVQNGDWYTGSTWSTGAVPTPGDNVVINHAVTSDGAIIRDAGTNTLISAGHSLAMRATYTNNGNTYVKGTFQLDNNGYANGNNNFIYSKDSYLVFNNGGNYDINSGQRFWPSANSPYNVSVNTWSKANMHDGYRIIEGTLNLADGFINNNGITINGTLLINAGGYIEIQSPVYGSASLLKYNTGGIYNNGLEWTSSTTPANVQLSNGTTLNYPVQSGARVISGDLTIDASSSLYMDYGSVDCGGSLTVIGNVSVGGNLSLGKNYGDDLKTSGNVVFYSGYGFYPNDRALFFIKDGTQTITTPSTSALTIPYIVLGRTGGSGTTLQILQDLTVSSPSPGNAISFTNASDILDINGRSLTIGTNNVANAISGNGSFKGSALSSMTLLGTGDFGTLNFTTGSQMLNDFTINRTLSGKVTLGTPLTIGSNINLISGLFILGVNDLTLSASATVSGSPSVNNMIVADGNGKFIKMFSSAGTFSFPIGDNTGIAEYSPVTLSFTGGSYNLNSFISINVVNAKHPNNTVAASYIKRYWNIATNITGYSSNGTFNYADGDVTGTEADMVTGSYDGSLWSMGNTTNAAANTLTVTGETSLGIAYTGGDAFTPLASVSSDYFRSRQSGSWNDPNTWESSPNGSSLWHVATTYPSSSAKGIEIRNTHTITLTANATASNLIVDVGGVLTNTNSSGGYLLTISDDGTSAADFIINGTYLIFGTSPIFNSGATALINSSGLVRADDNAGAQQSDDFASSANVTFKTASVFEWNNTNAFATSGIIYFPNSITTDIPVFKISELSPTVGGGNATTFNGIVEIDKDFIFTGGSIKNFRNGITGSATLTQNSTDGNSFHITGSNAIMGGSSLKILLAHPMYFEGAVTIPVDSSVTISGGDINNSSAASIFTINGTIDLTNRQITNTSGSVIVYGIYRTSISGGFAFGSISNTSIPSGTIMVKPGSTIELYALGDQGLNARPDFANLIFSGSGIKTPSSGFNPMGTVTIKNDAILDCTGYNVGDANTNLTMTDNSRLIVNTISTQPSMTGIYTLTGGTIEFAGSNVTTETIRTETYHNIEITGNNVGNSGGNITLNSLGIFTVKSGGVFTINDNSIKGVDGTAAVVVESGGLFNCGNNKGFNGFTAMLTSNSSVNSDITNITLQTGSTVAYTRSNPPLSNGDQQITNADGLVYQNLILSGTGNKTAPSGTLEIKGDLSKEGSAVFVHNNGTVLIDGTSVQTYTSTSPQIEFYNFINNNAAGLKVNDSLSVYRLLSLNDGSKITLNKDITLRSDKNNTASIGKINTGIITYGSGRFIVERYINSGLPANGGHHKSWQFIATPAFGETIYATWQEGGSTVITGLGTWITDPSYPSSGFDGASSTSSMKSYDNILDDWKGITGTNIQLSDPRGYMLFVRGDRQVNTTAADPTPTVMRTRGKLYYPQSGYAPPVSTVGVNKFQSVGNPYASVIDFTKVNLTNVDDKYYAWDPSLWGNYGVGGYQTISNVTGWKAIPGGSTIYNSSDDYHYIQSGQAFFVYNSTASVGSLSFNESAKVDDGNHLVFRDPGAGESNGQLLITDLYNEEGRIADGNAVGFGVQYSNKIDKDDALKITNSGENFGLRRKGRILAVEARQTVSFGDTIFYDMHNLQKANYTLVFVPQNMGQSAEAFLVDQYLKSEQPISLTDTSKIRFSVNSESGSAAYNRFMLVFKAAAGPLPVTFISVDALFKNETVFVNWKVENEFNIVEYEIEHSADGIHFTSLSKVSAVNSQRFNYEYADTHYNERYNYYRIKSHDKTGKIEYSNIIKIIVKSEIPAIKIYRPSDLNTIQLQLINQKAGKYKISLYNSSGQLLLVKEIIYTGGNSTQQIKYNNYTAHGVYYLEILKANTERQVIKLIK